jgi:hypothetical protein
MIQDFRDAAQHCFMMLQQAGEIATYDWVAPHVTMRPKLFIDGNQWCALYGENLQDGVAGFGDSPAKACSDFDDNWQKSIDA